MVDSKVILVEQELINRALQREEKAKNDYERIFYDKKNAPVIIIGEIPVFCDKLILATDSIQRIKLALNSGFPEYKVADDFKTTRSRIHLIKWGQIHKQVLPETKQQHWVEVRQKCPCEQLEKEVLELDENLDQKKEEDLIAISIGVILLSSLMIGTDIEGIRYYTNYSRGFIKTVYDNLTKYHVWENGQVYYEWADENGVIVNLEQLVAFWCDVGIGEGKLGRCKV